MSTRLAARVLPLVVWLGGFVSLTSCGGASRVELEHPLPFRIALMPIEVQETDILVATPASFSEDLPRLALDAEDVTASIVATLQGRGFTDIHPFSYPADSTAFQELSESEKFERWMDEAQAAQADMLLRLRLFYEPNIDGETNEKFWLNLPLFLLGGPFCYFINDRTYSAKAKLEAQFFSVTARRRQDGQPDPDLSAVLPLPLQAEYNGSQLDFTDRAGKNAGAYALSLLIPAGLLVRNSDEVTEEVHDLALEELATSLLDQIANQQGQFHANFGLARFELDPAKSSARRTTGSKVALSAAVRDDGTGLKRFTVRSASTVLGEGDLSQERGREHQIQGSFELPGSESLLHLEIEDGRSNRRSYTFRVEPGQ